MRRTRTQDSRKPNDRTRILYRTVERLRNITNELTPGDGHETLRIILWYRRYDVRGDRWRTQKCHGGVAEIPFRSRNIVIPPTRGTRGGAGAPSWSSLVLNRSWDSQLHTIKTYFRVVCVWIIKYTLIMLKFFPIATIDPQIAEFKTFL